MNNIVLLKAGGFFHLFCAATHVFFPKMFLWQERLSCLSPENLYVIGANLNIMNFCLLFMWVMLAYIPLFLPEEMLQTKSGRSLLFFIVMFWVFRIFVLQPIYGGFGSRDEIVAMLIFGIGLILFAIPLVRVLMGRGIDS